MIVVGGTYDEYCFEPKWNRKFGSGLRACWALAKLNPGHSINYYTFGDRNTRSYLEQLQTEIPIASRVIPIPKTVQFWYDHPLSTPIIYPRPDTLNKTTETIKVVGDEILLYGTIEGEATVTGRKVVYDPQSPSNPKLFSETGSKAEELAIVINLSEAKQISKIPNNDIESIKSFLFEHEQANVIILKMGAKGALVLRPDYPDEVIPVYQTKSVWPIGSGDVFAASFAHHWFKTSDAILAANQASWDTAIYCNTKTFDFIPFQSDTSIKPFVIKSYPQQQVYLAGPFFTYAERWLVDQIYQALKGMNLNVFSPWHDIGFGDASTVVPLDLEGLQKSKLVFAIVDGLDAGTLFEIGYAIAKNCSVIGYVENETAESIKMLEGTQCHIERDLTTAVYKALWLLAENE